MKWWQRNWLRAAPKQESGAAAIHALPPLLNPSQHEQLEFAAWRADHIQRWLDDPTNEQPEKRSFLEAERDMYRAILRQNGRG